MIENPICKYIVFTCTCVSMWTHTHYLHIYTYGYLYTYRIYDICIYEIEPFRVTVFEMLLVRGEPPKRASISLDSLLEIKGKSILLKIPHTLDKGTEGIEL